MINVFHILSGRNFLRKRKLLSRDCSAHTAKRMCLTEPCTTGETRRVRTRAKVVISCSTFSNQWRIQRGFLVARNPPPDHNFFIQGVTPLLAPTLTSHLHLRLLETPLETNSGYATGNADDGYSLTWIFCVSNSMIC